MRWCIQRGPVQEFNNKYALTHNSANMLINTLLQIWCNSIAPLDLRSLVTFAVIAVSKDNDNYNIYAVTATFKDLKSMHNILVLEHLHINLSLEQ